MFKRFPGSGSLLAVLALWVGVTVGVLRDPPGNVLSWDTFGYYLYLPAVLLHGDPGLQDQAWVQQVLETYHSSATFYQAGQVPDGRWVMKYPMGLAVLWSPFFVLGHLVAGATGHPQDGFSAPYQWAVIGASLVYILVGLLVLRRVLLHFFSDRIAAFVIAVIVLGTNYLHQSIYGSGMPHIFLFALYAGILWHSIRWHAHHRRADAIILAFLMGLAILCRPSEVVCLLIPLLVGLQDPRDWKAHLRALLTHRTQLAILVMILFAMGLPQFIYWKWLTGKFLYMSYNNPGEGFEFLHPYVWEVLFSFRKGWYIYTPVMVVATAGLFLLRKQLPKWSLALIVFFALNLFIIGSWSCWWYADSFGQRALVQSYAVMALPLGAVLVWLGRSRARVLAGGSLLVVLVAFNLFQTYQSVHGLIHTSRMTWPAYKAVFGRVVAPVNLPGLLVVDRSSLTERSAPDLRDYRMNPFRTLGFDAPIRGSGPAQRSDTIAYKGSGSYRLSPHAAVSPSVHEAWERLTTSDHLWVHVSCAVHLPSNASTNTVALVTAFQHNGFAYWTKTAYADPAKRDADGWARIAYWYLTPEVRRPTDELVVHARLTDGSPTFVDEIEVTLYEPIRRN